MLVIIRMAEYNGKCRKNTNMMINIGEKAYMIRMEIALILIMSFVAYMYFSAEKRYSMLHKTFSVLLVVVIIHLSFDAITIYTVNHLDIVPRLLNDVCHRFFVGTMAVVLYLFYQYIAILIEEETQSSRKFDLAAKLFLAVEMIGVIILPIHYTETDMGNYSSGSYAYVSYAGVAVYLLLCAGLLFGNWKRIHRKKKFAIGVALLFEFTICLLQGINHTWLISGMGIALMTLAFYLTLENPDIIRAELTEQKMSMLYLKSQVNPHFLYNTLDTIRIQSELDGNKKVADLLMKLVDFFRLSVKVNQSMVTLEEELELLENYMDLMCYRYPKLTCSYDIDLELYGESVPNFILQPLVENSLLHGLKDKGYQGELQISAHKVEKGMEICIKDSGSGFAEGKKAEIDAMLLHCDRQEVNLEGNSIGLLNVQKRIKLLCGKEYGLFYTENEGDGVTAHLLLPVKESVT